MTPAPQEAAIALKQANIYKSLADEREKATAATDESRMAAVLASTAATGQCSSYAGVLDEESGAVVNRGRFVNGGRGGAYG